MRLKLIEIPSFGKKRKQEGKLNKVVFRKVNKDNEKEDIVSKSRIKRLKIQKGLRI